MDQSLAESFIDDLPIDAHPRMAGKGDLRRVAGHALALSPDEIIVEMGPWLGFLSRELAKYGRLHVVDNFFWTKDHDRRYPGHVEPGTSFRPLFQSIMARTGTDARVHETDFSDFEWTGDEIALLVIDSPKTARALQICLSPVVEFLKPGARVLIKNGLNPKHHDLMAYVSRLVADGHFRFGADNNNEKSNILTLEATCEARRTRYALVDLLDPHSVALADAATLPNVPGAFRLTSIAQKVEAGDWRSAYQSVAGLEPDPGNIKLWDSLEHSIDTSGITAHELALFSDVFHFHNSIEAASGPEEQDISRSPLAPLRSYWALNADKPWRATAFQPTILYRAAEFGYMAMPQRIREHLAGRDVLDIGCGSGLHGLGYLSLGAKSVLGIDPAIRTDKDRVKNLVTKKREGFGWTPDEISGFIAPWQVLPVAFEEFDTEQCFDLAVLHDCLAHVDDVEAFVHLVAQHLRPGGRMVFRHKNFYCWNGHSQAPKTVESIDPSNPQHMELVDWNHLTWNAPADHYVERSLNRVRLDDLMAAVSAHFEIERLEENRSSPSTGFGRLTDEIRQRHPNLEERDFLVQNLVCTARVK